MRPGRPHRIPAAPFIEGLDEIAAGEVRKDELVADHRGRPRHRRRRHGAEAEHPATAFEGREAVSGQPLHEEALHHEGGVAFEEAQERERAIVVVRKAPVHEGVNVHVLVLEGVPQLVGQHELVHGSEALVLGDHVEPPLLRPLVVEAHDVLFQHRSAEGAQVDRRGKQVEGQQGTAVGLGLRARILGVEQLLEVAGELLLAHVLEGDRSLEGHAPHAHHLGLELALPHLGEAQKAGEQRVHELGRVRAARGRALRPPGHRQEEEECDRREAPPGGHARTHAGKAWSSPRTV